MINFVFLSQLSHFYALTLKHSTLIYSHSCYSHRFWFPVHTLFSITSLSFVSHFIVSLVRIWRERAKTCFIRSLNTGRCNVCSNYAFVGVFWYISNTVLTKKKRKPTTQLSSSASPNMSWVHSQSDHNAEHTAHRPDPAGRRSASNLRHTFRSGYPARNQNW